MMRSRDLQGDLFDGHNMFAKMVKEGSFYNELGRLGDRLFPDEKFEKLYCADNGRPCVAPSKMFRLLLLQIHDKCSDQEAVDRSLFDIRWKVALDIGLEERLCGRSTLQEFRARLHVSPIAEACFLASVDEARRVGLLKCGPLTVAIDTTPVFGRGALKDTFNLLADGIRKLVSILAELDGVTAQVWAEGHYLGRYWGSSIKGEANIDWSDQQAKKAFLNGIVADADRLLVEVRDRLKSLDQETAEPLKHAARLLMRIMTQDTEPDKPTEDPPNKRRARSTAGEGETSQPRTEAPISQEVGPVDPAGTASPPARPAAETAPPHELASEHPATKAPVPEEPLSTPPDAEIAPPHLKGLDSAPQEPAPGHPAAAQSAEPGAVDRLETWGADDSHHLLGEMVRMREGATKDRLISVSDPDIRHGRKSACNLFYGYKQAVAVEPISGVVLSVDVFPGNAPDKQGALTLVQDASKNAKAPVERAVGDCAYGDGETRQAFKDAGIELAAKVPSPPANDPYHKGRSALDLTNRIITCPEGQSTSTYDYTGKRAQGGAVLRFLFPSETCQACPQKGQCLRSEDRNRGRTVTLHPQEELLQEARARQASCDFREDVRLRQAVEHRQARLVQLGCRQARYFGIHKTRFQSVMTALVANLGLVFFPTVVLIALAPSCRSQGGLAAAPRILAA